MRWFAKKIIGTKHFLIEASIHRREFVLNHACRRTITHDLFTHHNKYSVHGESHNARGKREVRRLLAGAVVCKKKKKEVQPPLFRSLISNNNIMHACACMHAETMEKKNDDVLKVNLVIAIIIIIK